MNKIEEKNKIKVTHRSFEGKVLVARGDKTINVLVESKIMHPKYRKQYLQSRKYLAHDENNLAKVGDKVLFEECRPLSKTKRWRLVKVL